MTLYLQCQVCCCLCVKRNEMSVCKMKSSWIYIYIYIVNQHSQFKKKNIKEIISLVYFRASGGKEL